MNFSIDKLHQKKTKSISNFSAFSNQSTPPMPQNLMDDCIMQKQQQHCDCSIILDLSVVCGANLADELRVKFEPLTKIFELYERTLGIIKNYFGNRKMIEIYVFANGVSSIGSLHDYDVNKLWTNCLKSNLISTDHKVCQQFIESMPQNSMHHSILITTNFRLQNILQMYMDYKSRVNFQLSLILLNANLNEVDYLIESEQGVFNVKSNESFKGIEKFLKNNEPKKIEILLDFFGVKQKFETDPIVFEKCLDSSKKNRIFKYKENLNIKHIANFEIKLVTSLKLNSQEASQIQANISNKESLEQPKYYPFLDMIDFLKQNNKTLAHFVCEMQPEISLYIFFLDNSLKSIINYTTESVGESFKCRHSFSYILPQWTNRAQIKIDVEKILRQLKKPNIKKDVMISEAELLIKRVQLFNLKGFNDRFWEIIAKDTSIAHESMEIKNILEEIRKIIS